MRRPRRVEICNGAWRTRNSGSVMQGGSWRCMVSGSWERGWTAGVRWRRLVRNRTARRGRLDLAFFPHHNWGSHIPSWHGLALEEIGRVVMSVSSLNGMAHLIHVLVAVPARDPDWLPPAVLLGTQFLVERCGFMNLDCH